MWHIYTWLKLLEKFKTETSLWSMSRTLEDQICRLWIRSPKISCTSCTYLLTLHLYFRKLAGFLRVLNPWWQNKVSCWGQVFRWSQRSSNSGVDGLTSEERSVDVRSAARFPPAPTSLDVGQSWSQQTMVNDVRQRSWWRLQQTIDHSIKETGPDLFPGRRSPPSHVTTRRRRRAKYRAISNQLRPHTLNSTCWRKPSSKGKNASTVALYKTQENFRWYARGWQSLLGCFPGQVIFRWFRWYPGYSRWYSGYPRWYSSSPGCFPGQQTGGTAELARALRQLTRRSQMRRLEESMISTTGIRRRQITAKYFSCETIWMGAIDAQS